MNTKTVIRKNGNIQVAVTKTSKPEAMITKSDFDKYWISIEGDRLAVGKGEPGENKVLSWRDPQPTPGVKYIGFGSWHNPVLIKNIKILPPMVTEEKLARRFDPLKVHDWFNQGRFADVMLRTPLDEFEIVAHRAVLFAASRPFENLVRSSADGQSTTHLCPVHLLPPTLPGPILQQLIKFIYTGKVAPDAVDPAALLQWASHYELKGLVAICEAFNKDPIKWAGCDMKLHSLRTATENATTSDSSSSASSTAPPKSVTPPPASSAPSSTTSTASAPSTPSGNLATFDSLRTHDYSRLYQRSLFSDVSFIIKSPTDAPTKKADKTIPAHKIILAMKSEPLGLMFTTGMRESTMKVIEFTEDYEIFELMLRFIYSGNGAFLAKLSLEDTLLPLLSMADRFAVYPLRTALSDSLAETIDLNNVCTLLNAAAFYRLTTLRRRSLQFIEQNFSRVTQTEAFLGLESGPLLEIVFGDDLAVPLEQDVFDALLVWGTGSPLTSNSPSSHQRNFSELFHETFTEEEKAARLVELSQLLSYVRYPLMNVAALQNVLDHCDVVKSTAYLLELVQDAIADKKGGNASSSSMSSSFGANNSGFSLSGSMNADFGGTFSPGSSFSNLPSMNSSFGTLPALGSSFGTLPAFYMGESPSQTAAPIAVQSTQQLSQPRKSSSAGLGAFHTNARKSSAVQFLFSHCGDENGVIFWLATNQNTERWQNPHKLGRIQVSCSSPPSRWTSLPALVNRSFITNNFASGSDTAPAWWMVDLGIRYRLMCNYYTLQTDGSANIVGDWDLQGSVDKYNWTTLRAHENSRATFTQGGGKEFSWAVDLTSQSLPGYRYFRLIVSGTSAAQAHKFSLSGVEFYGYLNRTDAGEPETDSAQLLAAASSATSSKV